MAQVRQDARIRRIAELEDEVAELQANLLASEHSLVELGLRLSQENEALRKELAELRQPKENIGPRMHANTRE